MDDQIPISALQHYAFCPRQCAYIHIERIWLDNYLTAKGTQLHERVHSTESEKRGNIKTERGVHVYSNKYGITGQLDLLEIQKNPLTLTPVEYKRGKSKVNDCDRIQLCAQALCLEEMRNVSIDRAALWYWQECKREWIDLDSVIREKTIEVINAVRELLNKNELPKAKYSVSCKACSFFDICQPLKKDHSFQYVRELFDNEKTSK
jgi:CRISPR-associated exonuclease Cas4